MGNDTIIFIIMFVALIIYKFFEKKKERRFDNFRGTKVEKAHAYIDSKEWDKKRKERLKIDKYTCRRCGITDVPLQVHHKTYKNHTRENVRKDLVTVCNSCHEEIHKRFGYPTYGRIDREERRYWDNRWGNTD